MDCEYGTITKTITENEKNDFRDHDRNRLICYNIC
jgi:hypothetical protein